MRITDISTLCLSRIHERERQWATANERIVKADCAIVRVETDEGLIGYGEACAYGTPSLIADWVTWLGQGLVGLDLDAARAYATPTGRSWSYDCAVAGIDCALWDLRGKAAGSQVSALLASTPQTSVRTYASGGVNYDWRDDPSALLDEVLGYIDAGFSACKIRLGTAWEWDGVTPSRFLGLMEELTAAVGGRMELMVDGNQRLTQDEALAVAVGLEKLGFTWFEEPIPQEEISGYSRLNGSVGIPITGGEQLTTVEQFRPYLDSGAFAIVQPDAGWCGITEMLKIAALAASYGVPLAPHSWHNGAMALAHAHVLAALPASGPLEICMVQGPLQTEILAGGLPLTRGRLLLPDAPGLGIELTDGLEERFPYIEGDYDINVERLPAPSERS
jgi:L-alanine-DL-glutamate epimerase-like enolase superfamily enzyme